MSTSSRHVTTNTTVNDDRPSKPASHTLQRSIHSIDRTCTCETNTDVFLNLSVLGAGCLSIERIWYGACQSLQASKSRSTLLCGEARHAHPRSPTLLEVVLAFTVCHTSEADMIRGGTRSTVDSRTETALTARDNAKDSTCPDRVCESSGVKGSRAN